MGSTSDLVGFIDSTDFSDIPSEAIEKIKLQILDCSGVGLAASNQTIAKIILSHLKENSGKKQSTVIGHPLKASCPDAAWANGTIAHALDLDDNSIDLPTAIHQTVTALPAALSIGELVNASGRELLEATAIGIETASKVDRAMEGHSRNYHGTGTFGTLVSTITAGKLLKLNAEQMEYALGIACSMAAGLVANFGTMTKPLHAGQASRNGVVAALLAEKGFTSRKGILEAKEGFIAVVGKRLDPTYLKKRLGNPWEVLEPGIHLKAYPSCMATHAGLDAVLGIVKTHNPDPSHVRSVEVTSRRDLREALIYNEPRTALEGKFSMQFCMAVSLLEGRVTLDEFTDKNVRDPRIVKLMKRVKLLTNSKLPGLLTTKVIVTMDDERDYGKVVEYPRGSKNNPMTVEEVVEKFKGLTRTVLPQEKVEEIIRIILDFENLDSVKILAGLLTPA